MTTLKNTGKGDKIYVGEAQGLFLSPVYFEFATVAAAKVKANWTTLINAVSSARLYPIVDFFKADIKDNEPVKESGSYGKENILYYKGAMDTFEIDCVSFEEATRLLSFNGQTLYAMVATQQGLILAVTDGTKVKSLKVKVFATKVKAKGSDSQRLRIEIQSQETKLEIENGIEFEPDFNPITELEGIRDVTLTVTDADEHGCTLSVVDAYNGAKVVNLVKTDLILKSNVGGTVAIETITTLTLATDGSNTYSVVYEIQVGSPCSLELKNQPDMTTKGYESTDVVLFDVGV